MSSNSAEWFLKRIQQFKKKWRTDGWRTTRKLQAVPNDVPYPELARNGDWAAVSEHGTTHHNIALESSAQIHSNTTLQLLEEVEILYPVTFVEFCSAVAEEKSKNVSVNQRSGRPSWFDDRPEKQKLGIRRWDIASCQISIVEFCSAVAENKRMSQQIRHMYQGGPFGFPIDRKNTI